MQKLTQILSLLLLITIASVPHAHSTNVTAPADQQITLTIPAITGTGISNSILTKNSHTTDKYMKEGDQIVVDYNIANAAITDANGLPITITGGQGSITLDCVGETNNGGWEISNITGDGVCWAEQQYTIERTINGHIVIETFTLPAQNLYSDPNNISIDIDPITHCTGNNILGGPNDIKRFCEFNNIGEIGTNDGLTGRTGDDMFRLSPGGKGFIEYLALGTANNFVAKNRLTYFRRTGGPDQGIMIPAGPAGTFDDYHNFISNGAGALVETKKGCFNAEISLCNIPPTSTLARIECADSSKTWNEATQSCDGVIIPPACGSSHNTEPAPTSIPTSGLCTVGTPSAVAGSGPWTWSCNVAPDLTESCYTKTVIASCSNGTILPQGVEPTEQNCAPTEGCLFQVSGNQIGAYNDQSSRFPTYEQIGEEILTAGHPFSVRVSSLIKPGEYPKTSPFTGENSTQDNLDLGNSVYDDDTQYPFLYADAGTFDAMAIGSTTRVVIYSEENFQGDILFDSKGPVVINNRFSYGHDKVLDGATEKVTSWLTDDFPAPYQQMFPPETRQWSTEDMRPWGRGTSVKVDCTPPPPPTCDNGTVLPQGVAPTEQNCRPTDSCFLHVSGLFIGSSFEEAQYGTSEIGDSSHVIRSSGFRDSNHQDDEIEDGNFLGDSFSSKFSNLVGAGEYTMSSPHEGFGVRIPPADATEAEYPFLHADSITFDGMAIGKNTKVTIYSEENFGGNVLFDGQGPQIINNNKFQSSAGNSFNWMNADLPEPFNEDFPPEVRGWSGSDMHTWGRGTSVKVECVQPAGQWVNVDYKDEYLDSDGDIKTLCDGACENISLSAGQDHNGASCASGSRRPENPDGSEVTDIAYSHGVSGNTTAIDTWDGYFRLSTASYGTGSYQNYCITGDRMRSSDIRDRNKTVACYCE